MAEHSRIPIKALQVEYHGVGRYRTAHDVGDLSTMLLDWPADKGDAWRHALVKALEALELQTDAADARAAFVGAAHEADMSVLPDDVPQASEAAE